MLLQQTVLLSLCLSINAHHIRGHSFGGGNRGGGWSTSSSIAGEGAVASSSSSSTVAAASSSSSSTAVAAAASSSVASGSGSGIVAGLGNSSSVTAAQTTGGGDGATLLAANIQPASDSDGQANVEAGQSPSVTDPDNFINFCSGKNTTDGFQVVTGSCNGIVMGDIPSSENMISSIITNPAPGDVLQSNTNFTVNVQVTNLAAGSFTNPLLTYYAAPQALKNGIIVGHTHVTIQSLGNSLNPSAPPSPQTPTFFKGINDDGNGQGGLSAVVAGGLPAGNYRVCTMTSASNHQPVLMPVANRGAQDDCTKFTVSDSGTSTAAAVASTSSAAVSSTSGSNSTSSFGHKGRFARRAYVA